MSQEIVEASKAPYSEAQIQLIKNTVAKGATNDELKLFMVVAHKSGLDPFTKQIHFVKRKNWNAATRSYDEVGSIQTGIDGYRAIAERTGTLAGIDDAVFDSEELDHPNKATVTIYRLVAGNRVGFTASARWSEYAQQYEKNGQVILGTMWKKMPYLMLAKCAEALALRKAFPNDLSGVYTHEEMQQADSPQSSAPEVVEAKPVVEVNNTQQPSPAQISTIKKIMATKGYEETDLMEEGFSNLDSLTGGRGGTASELIDWLIKAPRKDS